MRNWICSRLVRSAGLTLSLLILTWPAATYAAAATAPAAPLKCADATPPCDASSAAAISPTAKIDPDNLLLFSVEIDRLTLTEGLAAYGDLDDPLIPFGELTRLLEYDVDVLPAERRIVGRLGEARTSMIVDLATGTARVGAKTISLTAADVAVTPTEIYLRASAVQRLLPLKMKVDHEALDIVISPLALLPVQSRLERLARERQTGRSGSSQESVLKVPSPYHLFTLPNFDVGLTVGAGSGSVTQGAQFPLQYELRGGGDLLYAGYQGYVASDETGKLSSARVTLERRSLEGRLLGPLHARDISVGDVFTPGLTIGPHSLEGRGISFSTVPLDQTNIFNRIDLRGELPIGYDVELYINDVLQSGQNTPNKGRYEFLNVPLSRGVNVIRIVTYGPHGERSEDTRVVNVGGGQLEKGEMTFEFGAVQQEKAVINLTDTSGTDFVSPGAGGLRMVGSLNYGLTQLITLSAGAALIPTTMVTTTPDATPAASPTTSTETSRGVYTLGAKTSLFGFLTQFDFGGDTNGGTAEGVGLAGQLFGVSTVLRYLQFQGGFVDENGPGVDFTKPLASRGELSFDGNTQIFGRVIPLSLRGTRVVYESGETDLTGSLRGSATLASVLFSTGFDYTHNSGAGVSGDTLTGFFAGSTYRNFKWQIRTTLDYDILPTFKPLALAVTVDRDLSDKASLRFGVGEQLDDFKSFNVTASAIIRTHVGDLALTGDYNNGDQSWQLGAQVNFGLAYNGAKHTYDVVRAGPGTGGSVAFHAFIDKNGNGRWDPGEPGVANVVVEGGGGGKAVTNADGRAFVTGLGAGPTTRLNVNLDKLDNPQVKSPPLALQLSPRPGQVTDIEFPMQPTGEVMIRILLRRPDGARVGLSGVIARLVTADGRSGEAKTEFDGSASFEDLVAGTYHLELDADQAKRLRMHLVSPLTVTIKGDGGFTPDASTEVTFDPRPQVEDQG
ncbi:MAG TPA: hypothetical protein VHV27_01750 [Phenylobacterium sp.]|nr:hypothetical protein [Phenylobacterium sp.]